MPNFPGDRRYRLVLLLRREPASHQPDPDLRSDGLPTFRLRFNASIVRFFYQGAHHVPHDPHGKEERVAKIREYRLVDDRGHVSTRESVCLHDKFGERKLSNLCTAPFSRFTVPIPSQSWQIKFLLPPALGCHSKIKLPLFRLN